MYDPFLFPPPSWLSTATDRLFSRLDLTTLPLHIHEVLLAFTFYHIVCTSLSPGLSAALFPNTYPKLNKRTKLNWNVHVTSLVQSTLISGLSLWVMHADTERTNMDWRERVWGYTGGLGLIEGLGAGYFLWDLYISTAHVDLFGLGLLAHAASAFWVFALGFRPFVNYYAPSFLLYELSSPFLNIHWFCDKLSLTGSSFQLFNGIALMASFFLSRLVWGVYQSYRVFSDVFRALDYQKTAEGKAWLALTAETTGVAGLVGGKAGEVMRYTTGREVPFWLAVTYLGSNAILTMLNVYWFGKMIETIRSRFPPPFGTKSDKKVEKLVVGRGVESGGDGEAVKSVIVEGKEVKQRKSKK